MRKKVPSMLTVVTIRVSVVVTIRVSVVVSSVDDYYDIVTMIRLYVKNKLFHSSECT